MRVGDFSADVSFLLDPLSAVMVLVVTGVGFLIHVYSIGYMADDPSYRRFFLYLNLFMFAMLMLVLADNFLLMFVGWEGVGLCSYLLIGFWYEKQSADRGRQEGVHRQPDRRLRLHPGRAVPDCLDGQLNYDRVFAAAPHLFLAGGAVITTATLLLFLGATGKSAQIPLYVWLPDAMEGPTPVSALIHAATMVTAGVYMVARCHVLFALAPGLDGGGRLGGGRHGAVRGHDRAGPERHQARARLLDREPARLHVSRAAASGRSARASST